MYLYVPRQVRAHPAVVVAIHYASGSGPAMFAHTQFASLANRYGFIAVYPSAPRTCHCFDVASPDALTHDGSSDPATIVSMVRWAEQHLNADPHQVFATGRRRSQPGLPLSRLGTVRDLFLPADPIMMTGSAAPRPGDVHGAGDHQADRVPPPGRVPIVGCPGTGRPVHGAR
jgi:hypothetical protein